MQFELNFKGLELLLFILWSKVICSSFAELLACRLTIKPFFNARHYTITKWGQTLYEIKSEFLLPHQFHETVSIFSLGHRPVSMIEGLNLFLTLQQGSYCFSI